MAAEAGLGQVGDMAFHGSSAICRHAQHPASTILLELLR
jgi:hypothetical protein